MRRGSHDAELDLLADGLAYDSHVLRHVACRLRVMLTVLSHPDTTSTLSALGSQRLAAEKGAHGRPVLMQVRPLSTARSAS